MKIGFVVMKRVENSVWFWEPVKVCYTNEELKEYRKKPDYCVATEETFYTIQGLQYNTDFQQYFNESRAYLKIPEKGLPFKRFCKKYQESYDLRTDDDVVDPEYQDSLLEYWYFVKRMRVQEIYYLKMGAGGYTNRELLTLYGIVVPVQDEEISWQPYITSNFSDVMNSPYAHISINIYNYVSKNQIIEYIRKHYKEIEKFIGKNLPKRVQRSKYILDKKDIQQLELKAQGYSHGAIFKEIGGMYNNNPDNVKIKYRRAVLRVKKMFSLKSRDY